MGEIPQIVLTSLLRVRLPSVSRRGLPVSYGYWPRDRLQLVRFPANYLLQLLPLTP